MTPEIDTLVRSWRESKSNFQAWQEHERVLRGQVKDKLFPEAVKGTQRYDLGNGHKVKLVQSYKYELMGREKKASNEEVENLIDKIDALGNEGPAIAARLIKWTPELSQTEYLKLDVDFPIQAAIKKLVDEMLVIKDASPVLEIEEPK